jgi:hypothetical protein
MATGGSSSPPHDAIAVQRTFGSPVGCWPTGASAKNVGREPNVHSHRLLLFT